MMMYFTCSTVGPPGHLPRTAGLRWDQPPGYGGAGAGPLGIRGREAETAVLDDAIDRAAAGRLAVVLIDGEAWIGKTRLLQDALDTARRRGLRVAAARAAELGSRTWPFGLVAGMFGCIRTATDPRLAGDRGAAGRLGPRGPRPGHRDQRPGPAVPRRGRASADLAEELALERPLLLGADDLHWADPSSLVKMALAARLDGLPVAIIGRFRPAPAGLERLASVLETAGSPTRPCSSWTAGGGGTGRRRRLRAARAAAARRDIGARRETLLFVTELLGCWPRSR